jgi:hypothetical protein
MFQFDRRERVSSCQSAKACEIRFARALPMTVALAPSSFPPRPKYGVDFSGNPCAGYWDWQSKWMKMGDIELAVFSTLRVEVPYPTTGIRFLHRASRSFHAKFDLD